MSGYRRVLSLAVILAVAIVAFSQSTCTAQGLTPEALLRLQRVTSTAISPDGRSVAYIVEVPRSANDDPGASYSELHVYSRETKSPRPFLTGKVRVGSLAWSPGGASIASLSLRRGEKAATQVRMISINGRRGTDYWTRKTVSRASAASFRTSIGYMRFHRKRPKRRLESAVDSVRFLRGEYPPRDLPPDRAESERSAREP
jgi:dipeptidyl aminopeptidase/acylaminoacyl peptidase